MCKIGEILRQKFDLKCTHKDIAQSLNLSLSTISDYLTRAKALLVGANRYKQIENILKNNLEEEPINSNFATIPLPKHDNIRGANFYQ